jgi:alpha-galactosidase
MATETTKKGEDKGHLTHTQDAAARGLPGKMRKPIKVTLLGAGSFFTPRLVRDILHINGDQGGEFVLVDIDAHRLGQMKKLLDQMNAKVGKADRWKITASTERREVMAGSDYLISCVEVSGMACVRHDNDIPAKYGVNQCIGDTIGPGGLFKALRSVPVFLEILRDAEDLCPEAIVLNYTNPMVMMITAAGRTSKMPVVGLCHSVQGTSNLIAKRLGIPYEEMEWECAGINHLAWFTKLRHHGKDLYPQMKEQAQRDIELALKEGWPAEGSADYNKEIPEHHHDLIRKHMMLHFGAFITESSGHLSEYLPWYRKRPDLVQQLMRPAYFGESSYYANNWPKWRALADEDRGKMIAGEKEMDFNRSWEYASWIVEAHQKDQPYRIHGNVMNNTGGAGSLITNLASDACVEVACLIDQNGLNPTRYGALPRQMAAVCQSNLSMFDLGAQACIERSKELAIYALSLDPLTAAVCSLDEIKAMATEMFEAEKDYLPGFR